MFPDFSSNHKPYFELSSGFPPDYKGMILPGASVQTAIGKPGVIVMQEISLGTLSIELCSFRFLRKIKIPFRPNPMQLNIPVALQSIFSFRSRDIQTIVLKQGQHIFLHLAGLAYEALFEKEKDYLLFNIGYPEEAIEEISNVFPELFNAFFTKLKEGKAFVFAGPSRTPAAVNKITREIINSPYEGKPKEYIFDKKVKESVCALLIKQDSKLRKVTDPRSEDVEKLNAIANMLITHMDTHYPISELGLQTHMGKRKLQDLFHKLFGETLYKFQRSAKLEKARRLILEEKMSVKYAGYTVGYKSITAFETEFKKHFGYTPGSLLKKEQF